MSDWCGKKWPPPRPRGAPRCCTGRRAGCWPPSTAPTHMTIAYHARQRRRRGAGRASPARLGGARCTRRFDHAAAEAINDDSLRLPDPGGFGWLAPAGSADPPRALPAALADVERASRRPGPRRGPPPRLGRRVGVLFDRRFAAGGQFADDGTLAAADTDGPGPVPGRRRPAPGTPRVIWSRRNFRSVRRSRWRPVAERVPAAAWLRVLRAHQSRVDEGGNFLLRQTARGQVGAEHTSATLHSLLFTGHAHAWPSGKKPWRWTPSARYTAEVKRRRVLPRFVKAAPSASRAGCCTTSAPPRGSLSHHYEALDAAARRGPRGVTIAALEDLAEHCLDHR